MSTTDHRSIFLCNLIKTFFHILFDGNVIMRQEEVYSLQEVYHHYNSHREIEVFNYNAECSKFIFLET